MDTEEPAQHTALALKSFQMDLGDDQLHNMQMFQEIKKWQEKYTREHSAKLFFEKTAKAATEENEKLRIRVDTTDTRLIEHKRQNIASSTKIRNLQAKHMKMKEVHKTMLSPAVKAQWEEEKITLEKQV